MVRRTMSGIVFVGMFVLLGERALSDTWTNAVGATFQATPLELDGRRVIFQKPTGEQIRIPIFSLSSNEQERVKVYFNGPKAPAPLRSAYTHASEQLDRARWMFQEGVMNDPQYANRREEIIRSFKKTCERNSYAENGDEVQQLIARLLAR